MVYKMKADCINRVRIPKVHGSKPCPATEERTSRRPSEVRNHDNRAAVQEVRGDHAPNDIASSGIAPKRP